MGVAGGVGGWVRDMKFLGLLESKLLAALLSSFWRVVSGAHLQMHFSVITG